MIIDCQECTMRETAVCEECVVTFLLAPTPVELTESEITALDNLAGEGLVPGLRLVPRHREVS